MPLPWKSRCLVLLLAACAALALAVPGAQAEVNCTPGADWGTLDPASAQRVLALVNAHRRSLGLGELQTSATLTHAAEWKSLHLGHYGYFTHDDPGPPAARTFAQRIADCGGEGQGFGENIAAGQPDADAVMAAWLASPGHRENIERPQFTAIGIGVGIVGGTVYWTQDFGAGGATGTSATPAAPAPVTTTVVPVAPTPAPGSRDRGASNDHYAVGCRRWSILHVLQNDAIASDPAQIVALQVSPRVLAHVGADHETVVVKARSCDVRSAELRYAVEDSSGHTATATVTLRHRHRHHRHR